MQNIQSLSSVSLKQSETFKVKAVPLVHIMHFNDHLLKVMLSKCRQYSSFSLSLCIGVHAEAPGNTFFIA